MVQADRGYHRDFGCQDGGRVQPAPQPDLHHLHVRSHVRKCTSASAVIISKNVTPRILHLRHRLNRGPYPGHQRRELFLGRWVRVRFVPVRVSCADAGRCKTHLAARACEDRGDQRARAAFALSCLRRERSGRPYRHDPAFRPHYHSFEMELRVVREVRGALEIDQLHRHLDGLVERQRRLARSDDTDTVLYGYVNSEWPGKLLIPSARRARPLLLPARAAPAHGGVEVSGRARLAEIPSRACEHDRGALEVRDIRQGPPSLP